MGGTAPARWICTAGGLVVLGSLLANGRGFSPVTLVGRHEFDAAVVVPVVVPIHKRKNPLTGILFGGEWPAGVGGAVFDRTEQGFRVQVLVGDPWPGKGSQHAYLLEPLFQRLPTHGVAIGGMEDQWLLLALAAAKAVGAVVALLEAGPLHQIRCDLGQFDLGHIPGHHFAAPDIDHQVEPHPALWSAGS